MSRWRTPFPISFQFTPLREGRQRAYKRTYARDIFQFTPLREGRLRRFRKRRTSCDFNSRPSARGDCCRFCTQNIPRNFNSRPSARGDAGIYNPQIRNFISIHAPPRGATMCVPSWGRRSSNFNSRPSARGDDFLWVGHNLPVIISIHAPPRGATRIFSGKIRQMLFQFTPLREGRQGG